jgi:hypothetical protein
VNDFNDRINRLREIIEDARPHVSRLVADIVTTSFDQPINREQVRSWRERVNIRVAADAPSAAPRKTVHGRKSTGMRGPPAFSRTNC